MAQLLWLAQLCPVAASQLSPSIPDCWAGYNSNPLPAAAFWMLCFCSLPQGDFVCGGTQISACVHVPCSQESLADMPA